MAKFRVSFSGADDGFEELPAGIYTVENSAIESKTTKNGDPMLSVTHTVLEADDDKYVGRKMWSNFILEHENENVQARNRGNAKKFFVAIGLMDRDDELEDLEFDEEDVVGTQCVMTVKVTKKDDKVYTNYTYSPV